MSAGALSVDVVPLGGLGEFGLNMMAISCGDTTIVIDAGAMFPEPDLPGVDLIVPDLAYLESRRGQVKALVLTHGHEDHIGAVPYVLTHVSGPVYGTPLALALVQPKIEEHDIEHGPGYVPVKPRDVVTIGPFTLEFIRVTHSMPDCVAVAITTPQGVLLHTGDFKIDQTPLDGEAFDLPRFAQLGAAGVLALLCDSTNVDRRGFTGSEREVEDAFEVPLEFVLDPINHVASTRVFAGQTFTTHDIPYRERHIWGATAGMLLSLYQMLQET